MREILKGFFVLEGIDGSGTTTQLKRVAERARAEAKSLRTDCEPTGHPIGVLIRSIFRHETDALPTVLAPLFAADRRQHPRRRRRHSPRPYRPAPSWSATAISSRRWRIKASICPGTKSGSSTRRFPCPRCCSGSRSTWPKLRRASTAGDRSGRRYEDSDTQHRVRRGYHRAIAQSEAEGLEVVRLDASRSVEELADAVWARICR